MIEREEERAVEIALRFSTWEIGIETVYSDTINKDRNTVRGRTGFMEEK